MKYQMSHLHATCVSVAQNLYTIQIYAPTVWVDDMFMGTALLAAWSRISGQLEHLHFAAEQVDLVSLSGLVLKIIFIS